jgi:methyl-accepting chemotaxis protein
MMTDIATLGLAVDSRQVTTAASALNGLTQSARPAAAAAAAVEKASASAAKSSGVLAQQVQNASKQVGLARHELINFGRQMQDVGTMLAMGSSPMQVVTSQFAQVLDIFMSSKGSLRGFGSQVASVITPVRALGGGLAILATAGYMAYSSWKSFALQLDDTARAAGVTAREMSALQAAAGFKGISSDDFSQGIGRFAQQVYQAKNGMGELAQTFRANGVPAAKDFNSALENVAELIKRAKGDTQAQFAILQQAGLPVTMQWVRMLEGGAEGIRKARTEAVAFGGAANDAMVKKAREIDEAWNKLWTNVSLYSKYAFVQMASGLGSFLTDLNRGFSGQGVSQGTRLHMTMPMGGGGGALGAAPVDKNTLFFNISQAQATIGMIAKTPSAAELKSKTKGKSNERDEHRLPAAA